MRRPSPGLWLAVVLSAVVAAPVLAAHCAAADSCPLAAAAPAPCHGGAGTEGEHRQAPAPDCCDASDGEAPTPARTPLPLVAVAAEPVQLPPPVAADLAHGRRPALAAAGGPSPPLALRV